MHILLSLVHFSLILVLVFQPFLAYSAGTLTPDNAHGYAPSITTAQNGVPIVNITTPTSSGVSYNQFQDYNVHNNGIILNNNTNSNGVNTSLGGTVMFNPNLGSGSAASVIIAEVTSSNTSILNGYSEVAGQMAGFVLLNPNGITCNGCGFINTSRLTLATGTGVYDTNYNLQHINILNNAGVVINNGTTNAGVILGLDGQSSDVDIVSRNISINGDIFTTKSLNLYTGNKSFDFMNKVVSSDENVNNGVAIDSSTMGGMYAGLISIVSTEKGMGVNVNANMVADTSNLVINANGDVVLKADVSATQSGGNVVINANNVVNNNNITADTINIQADELNNESGANINANTLEINAENINNNGTLAGIYLNTLNVKNTLNNTGNIIGNQDININASNLINNGGIRTNGYLKIISSILENNNSIMGDSINIVSSSSLTNNKNIVGGNIIIESIGSFNNNGVISGILRGVSIKAQNLTNNSLIEGSVIYLVINNFINNVNSKVQSTSTLSLDSVNIYNAGSLIGVNNTNILTNILNNAGFIGSNNLSIMAVSNILNNGTISANNNLNIEAASLTNNKNIGSNNINIKLSGNLLNKGLLQSNGNTNITANVISNDAQIYSLGTLNLTGTNGATYSIINTGILRSNNNMNLQGNSLYNSGDILSAGSLSIGNVAGFMSLLVNQSTRNKNATIRSNGSMLINSNTVNNLGFDYTLDGTNNMYYVHETTGIKGGDGCWKNYCEINRQYAVSNFASTQSNILSSGLITINTSQLNNISSNLVSGINITGNIGALNNRSNIIMANDLIIWSGYRYKDWNWSGTSSTTKYYIETKTYNDYIYSTVGSNLGVSSIVNISNLTEITLADLTTVNLENTSLETVLLPSIVKPSSIILPTLPSTPETADFIGTDYYANHLEGYNEKKEQIAQNLLQTMNSRIDEAKPADVFTVLEPVITQPEPVGCMAVGLCAKTEAEFAKEKADREAQIKRELAEASIEKTKKISRNGAVWNLVKTVATIAVVAAVVFALGPAGPLATPVLFTVFGAEITIGLLIVALPAMAYTYSQGGEVGIPGTDVLTFNKDGINIPVLQNVADIFDSYDLDNPIRDNSCLVCYPDWLKDKVDSI